MASASVLPPTSRLSVEVSPSSFVTAPVSFTSAASSRRSVSSSGLCTTHVPRCLPSTSDASTSAPSSFPASSSRDTAGARGRELPSSPLERRTTTRGSSHLQTSSSAAVGVVGGEEAAADAIPFFDGGERQSNSKGRGPSMLLKMFFKLFRKQPLWRRIFFASKKVRSVILLNVLTVIYASDIPVLKEVEATTDPALFTMVRFTLSALPFLPFVFKARQDVKTRTAGIELGCWISLGSLAQALGLLYSDAGRASFISAFTVITVPLIDGFFGSTVPKLTWCGAVSSLVGVALLESAGSPASVGDFLDMLSAVFFGIHTLRTERISRVTKKEKYLPLLGYQIIVIALFSVGWYFLRGFFTDLEELHSSSGSWSTFLDGVISFPWIPAVYTGIFSTVLCLWAEIFAMRDVSATETAIIYGLEPLWGAAFAWMVLDERWDTIGWVGAMLILGGSLIVQIFGSPENSGQKSSRRRSSDLGTSEGPNDLTFSPVLVEPSKNVKKLPKKQDKL